MTKQDLISTLAFTNEFVSSAIVIISVSMLLYNLTRDVRDRVNRASSVLLGAVSWAYVADTFIAFGPSNSALEGWLRAQWLGIALIPAAMFHLSDSLLATTGLVSRGRRRRAVKVLYVVGFMLVSIALFSDALVRDLVMEPVAHMKAGPLFWLYLFYFVVAGAVSVINVMRAWRRCLTTYTQRRMTYLAASFMAPAWGLFPYSLLLSLLSSGLDTVPEVWLWVIFNIANAAVLAMLAFMAYPLSFFGTTKPERVIKAELLQFMLRGPLTGMVIVGALQLLPRVTNVLGIGGEEFTVFAVVGAVLGMQWGVTLIMPYLENVLIYTRDQQQAKLFQEIGKRLMTRSDAEQLLEALLAAVCDQLRVSTAFVAAIDSDSGTRLVQHVGYMSPEDADLLTAEFAEPAKLQQHEAFFSWRSFRLIPIYVQNNLLGLLGVWQQEHTTVDAETPILQALLTRIGDILSDMRLQSQVVLMLEGLVSAPTASTTKVQLANVSEYGQVILKHPDTPESPSIVANPEFPEMVRNALRDYWGGPKLMESELLHLGVVDEAALQEDGNRVNALRRVLVQAIEGLRPEGQQNFTRTEWILYNILEMRFLQGKKVRDVALRLAMSQADFYRKQKTAIEEVARIISDLEQQHLAVTELDPTPIPEQMHIT